MFSILLYDLGSKAFNRFLDSLRIDSISQPYKRMDEVEFNFKTYFSTSPDHFQSYHYGCGCSNSYCFFNFAISIVC